MRIGEAGDNMKKGQKKTKQTNTPLRKYGRETKRGEKGEVKER